MGQVIGPGPGSSTKSDRKVGLFFFPQGTGIDRSAVRTKSAIALRRFRTISPPVIPRSEATHPRVASLGPSGQFTFWESPGTRYSYQRSARRLPRPYGPRNDVVFFTRPFFWWCGPDTPGGVSLRCTKSLSSCAKGEARSRRIFAPNGFCADGKCEDPSTRCARSG